MTAQRMCRGQGEGFNEKLQKTRKLNGNSNIAYFINIYWLHSSVFQKMYKIITI